MVSSLWNLLGKGFRNLVPSSTFFWLGFLGMEAERAPVPRAKISGIWGLWGFVSVLRDCSTSVSSQPKQTATGAAPLHTAETHPVSVTLPAAERVTGTTVEMEPTKGCWERVSLWEMVSFHSALSGECFSLYINKGTEGLLLGILFSIYFCHKLGGFTSLSSSPLQVVGALAPLTHFLSIVIAAL